MNRDELTLLVKGEINDNAVLPLRDYKRTVDALADALWPVLAQAWAEGYIDGANDVMDGRLYSSHKTPNPYK